MADRMNRPVLTLLFFFTSSRCLHLTFLSVSFLSGHTKIGYALYFFSYSSWSGRAVFMEDLYVMPEFRGTVHRLETGNFLDNS